MNNLLIESIQYIFIIYYPFALNTYNIIYNEMNQEIQLKVRKSQEAVETYSITRTPSH